MGTEETTSVTEVAGEAPAPEVSESAPLPPAEGADVGVSPSSESGSSGAVSAETTIDSSQEAASFPTADSFGWDSWDGEIGGLDERVQPWAQKIWDHRTAAVEQSMVQREAETERLQTIYQELLTGVEDPRVAEGVTAMGKLQTKYDDLEKSSGASLQEYEEYKAAMDQQVAEEAEAIATAFRSAYPEIFSDPEQLTAFGELLAEDWDLEAIPKVMALGAEAQAIARQAKVAGTPDRYALQLAGSSISKPAAPRPGATITAGATGSAPSPHRAESGRGDAKSFDDIRNYAAGRALKAVSGGKRK